MSNFIVIENYLTESQCEDLIKEAGELDKEKFVIIQKKRLFLSNSSFFFFELIKQSKSWQKLNNLLNSDDFLNFCCKKLGLNTELFSRKVFFSKKVEKKYYKEFKLLGSKQLQSIKISSLTKYVALKFLRTLYRKFIYSNFFFWKKIPVELLYDYSKASNGYSNIIHRDTDNRIIVFLIYLNTTDGLGGELGIYRKINNTKIDLVDKIKPTPGKLVLFLNNEETLHGALELKNSSKERCFIYGSFTSLSKNNFIKFSDKQTTELQLYD